MLRVHRPLGMLLCNPLSACLVSGAGRAAPRGGRRRGLHGDSEESSSASVWRRPEAGRLKLNFDGSSKHASRRASIGGVYRDHEGAFVLGYAERIGVATSSVAELAALRRGLELAVANGWRGVWVEGDAKTVVDVVRRRARVRSEEDARQCEAIAALLPLLGDDMSVSHVRREGNRVAHGFAKLGHGEARPRVWRGVPPDEVRRFLQRDAGGK
ncbi:hypothetical protein ACP70R_043542 [Stipagrostis hirtigluma subsp. patula]